MAEETQEELLAALGRVPSGIYILTIGAGDESTGMLASWVQQAGFEPPQVSVALKSGRPINERIESGEPFAINIVGATQKHLLGHFGKGFAPGEPAFEGLELAATESGTPALAEAVGVLECRATGGVDAGDHRLIVAEVIAGRLQHDAAPMTHVRKRGDHY
ncbi:Putative diflavin flavoprotein A 3 [Planctomycetes bacterium MalM25]|nr:Putative diflavin flavoprotein A 3 [Planctomycetes bacterium MalM25]